MLKKRARLSAKEVKEVLAKGHGRRGTILSLKFQATTEPFQCAVIVSKKVAHSAVMRNKLRRAVYHALQASSLPPTGRAILFVQSLPKDPRAIEFTSDIKQLLHV
jgi:ribonuclease P protein component